MENNNKNVDKPFIAITARINNVESIPSVVNSLAYFNAIIEAGGIPIMIYHTCTFDYDEIAKHFDALLIPGGEDINPATYKQGKTSDGKVIEQCIDELDLQMIHAFHKLNKPILGICRGMQCLNVAFKGTLTQDIEARYTTSNSHDQRKLKPNQPYENTRSHEIVCKLNTKLYTCFKKNYQVNSFHHQCIDQVAHGFKITALSKEDHIIEGIEKGNMIGVQWHPEWLTNDTKSSLFFKQFIEDAKRRR